MSNKTQNPSEWGKAATNRIRTLKGLGVLGCRFRFHGGSPVLEFIHPKELLKYTNGGAKKQDDVQQDDLKTVIFEVEKQYPMDGSECSENLLEAIDWDRREMHVIAWVYDTKGDVQEAHAFKLTNLDFDRNTK